jgi:hypothetical protein
MTSLKFAAVVVLALAVCAAQVCLRIERSVCEHVVHAAALIRQ